MLSSSYFNRLVISDPLPILELIGQPDSAPAITAGDLYDRNGRKNSGRILQRLNLPRRIIASASDNLGR